MGITAILKSCDLARWLLMCALLTPPLRKGTGVPMCLCVCSILWNTSTEPFSLLAISIWPVSLYRCIIYKYKIVASAFSTSPNPRVGILLAQQKVSPAPAADPVSFLRPGCAPVWPGKAIQGSQLAWWLSQAHLRVQLCLCTRAVGTRLNTHKVTQSVWTRERKANTGIVYVSRGVFKSSCRLESTRDSCEMKRESMFNII